LIGILKARHTRAELPESGAQCVTGFREREQEALDKELPDELAAAGAQRASDRDLSLPCSGAREQKIRDVGTRDEQHGANQPLKDDERPLELEAECRLPPGRRNQREGLPEEAFPRFGKFLEESTLELLLLTLTDPRGNKTTLTYSTAGLIATISDPQKNATSFQYDARGNRTSIIDALKKTTSFAYDVMNVSFRRGCVSV
jgi:YD repeat-containing protein